MTYQTFLKNHAKKLIKENPNCEIKIISSKKDGIFYIDDIEPDQVNYHNLSVDNIDDDDILDVQIIETKQEDLSIWQT